MRTFKLPETPAQATELRAALAGVGSLVEARSVLAGLEYVAETCRTRTDAAMTAAIAGTGRADDAVRWSLIYDELKTAVAQVADQVQERERQAARDRVMAEDRAARTQHT